MNFDPVIAKSIIAANSLAPSTYARWESKGKIPDMYFSKQQSKLLVAGYHLDEARTELQLSQQVLCEQFDTFIRASFPEHKGISNRMYSKWEIGENMPTAFYKQFLINFFNDAFKQKNIPPKEQNSRYRVGETAATGR